MGIFVYILEMSSEAILWLGFSGISFKYCYYFILNVYGMGGGVLIG